MYVAFALDKIISKPRQRQSWNYVGDFKLRQRQAGITTIIVYKATLGQFMKSQKQVMNYQHREQSVHGTVIIVTELNLLSGCSNQG